MSRRHSLRASALSLSFLALSASLVRCSGTEADNPVADLVVTQCKSGEGYDPGQLDVFLNGTPDARAGAGLPKSTGAPGALRQPLTSTADIPMGLSCVEWQLTGTRLQVQIVNFDSSCGAEWAGNVELTGERITFALENVHCAVARCGSCIYDTASSIDLPEVTDVTLALSLDVLCDDQTETREWRLPLTTEPRGISCGFARPPGIGVQGPAFMWCTPEDTCEADLTCVPQGESISRCLPSCTADADCPLAGGTRCSEGLCRPASSVASSG